MPRARIDMKTTSVRRSGRAALVARATLALVSACAVGPDYERPEHARARRVQGSAAPADARGCPRRPPTRSTAATGGSLFGDPVLTALAAAGRVSNQNVAAAVAAYAQAQALVREQRAALSRRSARRERDALRRRQRRGPAQRQQPSRLGFTASWEPDFWGALRLAVEGAQASAQASAADLAAARLSAQGALATDYFALREADTEIALLTARVDGYERALQITQNRYDAGIAQRTDVLQAQTQLETTRADLVGDGAASARGSSTRSPS